MPGTVTIKLIDPSDDADRTTSTLFASLATRLITLHYMSGVSAIGSTLAGLAVLGAEISKTAEGARIRRALAASQACANGERIWKVLHIASLTGGVPASPVLDHVRNDLALLLSNDLNEVVANPPSPQEARPRRIAAAPIESTFLDTTLGLWAYSREIVLSIEALARQGAEMTTEIELGDGLGDGEILR
jgi:hypothetical protein